MTAQDYSFLPLITGNRQPAPPDEKTRHYVIFRLDRQRYALPLENVTRALRMVALTPVPEAPPWIAGVINMAGQVVSVVDLRRRFGQPGREADVDDRLLIVETPGQTIALVVDEVLQVLELGPDQVEVPSSALAKSRPLKATIKYAEGLLLLLDVDRLLPADEGAN